MSCSFPNALPSIPAGVSPVTTTNSFSNGFANNHNGSNSSSNSNTSSSPTADHMLGNAFINFSLGDQNKPSPPSQIPENGLGLDKLVTTTCGPNPSSNTGIPGSTIMKSNAVMPKSKSFEHFERQKWYEDYKNHESQKTSIPNANFMFSGETGGPNNMHSSHTSSLFSNNDMSFMSVTSSNDTMSLSSSSSPPKLNEIVNNEVLANANNQGVRKISDGVPPWGSSENGDHTMRLFSSKQFEAFSLTYYRTQSLPDVYVQYPNTQPTSHPSLNNEIEKFTNKNESIKNKTSNKPGSDSEEVGACPACRKNEICVYYLNNGSCRNPSCEKMHVDEPFQWQLLPKAGAKKPSGYNKNENTSPGSERRWLNLDKNENIKLEIAYSNVEAESVDIEYLNDHLTINLNEMVAMLKTENKNGGGNGGGGNQRKCSVSSDLNSWLIQLKGNSFTSFSFLLSSLLIIVCNLIQYEKYS